MLKYLYPGTNKKGKAMSIFGILFWLMLFFAEDDSGCYEEEI